MLTHTFTQIQDKYFPADFTDTNNTPTHTYFMDPLFEILIKFKLRLKHVRSVSSALCKRQSILMISARLKDKLTIRVKTLVSVHLSSKE